jgi:hypothetical protein
MRNQFHQLSNASAKRSILTEVLYFLYFIALISIVIGKDVSALIDFPNVLILIIPFFFLTLFKPAIGLSVFILYYLVGLKGLSPSYGTFLSLSILAEMCLLVSFFFQIVTTKKLPRIRNRLSLLLFLFISCYFISSLFRGNLINPDGTGIFKWLILMLIIYILIVYFVDSYENLMIFLRSFIFLGFIWFGASLYHIIKYGIKPLFFRSPIEKGYLEVIIDVNTLSTSVLMILPLVYYQAIQSKRNIWKGLALVCFPVCIFTVILTFSRNGFVALTVVLAMLFFRRKGSFKIWGSIAIIILIVLLTPGLYWSRIATIPSIEVDSGLMLKLSYFRQSLNIILGNPLIGVGYGNSFSIHNTFLQIAADLGILVLLLFLGIIYTAYKNLKKIELSFRDNDFGEVSRLPWLLVISLAAYIIGGLTISIPLFFLFIVILGLIMAFKNLYSGNSQVVQNRKNA